MICRRGSAKEFLVRVGFVWAALYLLLPLSAAEVALEFAIAVSGGRGGATARDVGVDATGNTYVVGAYDGLVDFDPGPGQAFLSTDEYTGTFLAKYDSDGEFQWVKNLSSDGHEDDQALDVDAAGSCYLWHEFSRVGELGPSVAWALRKYDTDGEPAWTVTFEEDRGERMADVRDLRVDPAGNVVLAGTFSDTVDFAPGAEVEARTTGFGTLFLAKYAAGSGELVWVHAFETPEGDSDGTIEKIATDAAGHIIITGSLRETIDFDPGPSVTPLTSVGCSDIYVARYSPAGNLTWAFSLGGEDFQIGTAVATDGAGNVYLMGMHTETIDLDPGPEVSLVSGDVTTERLFLARYDATGAHAWGFSLSSDSILGVDLATDADGRSFVLGTFVGDLDCDPGAGEAILHGEGLFFAKYEAEGTLDWALPDLGAQVPGGAAAGLHGRVVFAGQLRGANDFAPGAERLALEGDLFVARYRDLRDGCDVLGGARHVVSGTEDDEGEAVAVDGAGNLYVAGSFAGAAEFDASGVGRGLSSVADSRDAFLASYEPRGALRWATSLGGPELDACRGVAVDSDGHVYVTGGFGGSAGLGPAGASVLTSAGSRDAFIASYDAAGGLRWARRGGGTAFDEGRDVAVDSEGNVYVTGLFEDTAVFGPSGAGGSLKSVGGNDLFVLRYDSGGEFHWALRAGGAELDEGNGIAVDPWGDVYVTGRFRGTAEFDAAGTGSQLASEGGDDAFLACYSSAGSLWWATMLGGTQDDEGFGVSVDAAGRVYVTGAFRDRAGAGDTVLVAEGEADVFLAAFERTGEFRWALADGGPLDDLGFGVVTDTGGNVYLSGEFRDRARFGAPGLGEVLESRGEGDVFVASYDGAGCLRWAYPGGGEGADVGRRVAVDSTRAAHVVGAFRDTASFDPRGDEPDLASTGEGDVFLASYGCEEENQAPVALCVSRTLAAGTGCRATLVPADLDAGSFDPDGDPFDLFLDVVGPLGLGEHAVELTIVDVFGASDSCVTTVTVIDEGPPTLVCPAEPVTASATEAQGAVVDFEVTVEDSCAGQGLTVVCEPPSGAVFVPGVTTVSCTATDAAGNSATCAFDVEVTLEPRGVVLPGDCDASGDLDITDGICILGILFLDKGRDLSCGDGSLQHPANVALLSWNGTPDVDLSSAVALLNFLFLGGPPHVLGRECLSLEGCSTVCEGTTSAP